MLNKILADLGAGWWKFDYDTLQFTFSGFIRELLKLNSEMLSLEALPGMVRMDYREKLIQNALAFFTTEQIFPFVVAGEEFWVRSRYVGNETEGESKEVGFGYFQVVPCPEIGSFNDSGSIQAEANDKLKSAFIANISHEIRTPLNAIVGFSSILSETENKEERASYVSIIQENSDMLLQLITDILDISKIEAGTMEFSYNYVDVNALCTEIVDTYQLKLYNSPVRIVYGDHLPNCVLYTDKTRLIQVISNLINNAIKFTSEGNVTLGFHQEGIDKIRFFVCDTGCGISPDEQDVIFQRFAKLNNFVQGSGLGLSICRSIVEQLGGEIGVNSTEGAGSCFWFTHPYTNLATKK